MGSFVEVFVCSLTREPLHAKFTLWFVAISRVRLAGEQEEEEEKKEVRRGVRERDVLFRARSWLANKAASFQVFQR